MRNTGSSTGPEVTNSSWSKRDTTTEQGSAGRPAESASRPGQGRWPVFSSAMNAAQEAGEKVRTGPCTVLLSRTGTTPGNPSATSTQLPPS